MKGFILLTTTLTLALAGANAQERWELDKAHSTIGFSVTHMLISEVPGSFRDFDVELISSKDDFSDAKVTATIDVASIDTKNERRDGHLRSDDFFNASLYPTITFRSTRFERTGERTYKIHGDLTIRDVTKPVVFDATLIGTLNTRKAALCGWKATTTVNRFDYNLKWNRTLETGGLIVGEEVGITLNAEFRAPVQVGG